MNLRDILLSIIALLLLCLVALNFLNRPVTMEDFLNAKSIEDFEERSVVIDKIIKKMPLVNVHSGSLTVDGSVEVENTVSVEVDNQVTVGGEVSIEGVTSCFIVNR